MYDLKQVKYYHDLFEDMLEQGSDGLDANNVVISYAVEDDDDIVNIVFASELVGMPLTWGDTLTNKTFERAEEYFESRGFRLVAEEGGEDLFWIYLK